MPHRIDDERGRALDRNPRSTVRDWRRGSLAECMRAVEAIAPGRAGVLRRRDCRAIVVSNHWKHWVCLIPQHGPGRKHTRPIVLTDWQRRIVSDCPEAFLRGLIHSDGTRIIATERKGAYVRRAPRYAFSNRSEDILELVPFRMRNGRRPLHAVQRQADLGLQQSSGCAARRVRRPEVLSPHGRRPGVAPHRGRV